MLAGFAVWVLLAGLRHDAGWEPVVDVAELLAAGVATGCSLTAAGRCVTTARRTWLLVGCGLGSWTLGQAWWSVTELVLRQTVPVPSPADAFYLLLLPLVGVGLVVHPAAGATRAVQRVRLAMDLATVLVSLLLFAWSFTIISTWDATADSAQRVTLLAYPVGDLLLATLVITLVAHASRAGRPLLLWLLGGVLSLTAADSVFAYLAGQGSTTSTSVADLLWVLGFLSLAMAAHRETGDPTTAPLNRDQQRRAASGWAGLPYALVALSAMAVVGRWIAKGDVGRGEGALLGTLGVLVYVRQYTVLRDNWVLLRRLDAGQEQLHEQGLRDPLTGLANRAAFRELVDRALSGGSSYGAPTGHVLVKFRFADSRLLGNLSPDDEDLVVTEVAARIRGCLGADDHLARVAEGTFAVLRPGGQQDGHHLALQVVASLEHPVRLPGGRHHIQLAAAVAGTDAGPRLTAALLLQRAAVALNSIDSPAGGVAFFDHGVLRAHDERMELREALAQAVRYGPQPAVEVRFEPVVDLTDGSLTGAAARAAWRHPAAGTISGGALADLAREAGLSDRVDDALLEQAVAAYARWQLDCPGGAGDLWVTVSGESLAHPDFADRLLGRLVQAQVPPAVLVLDRLDRTDEAVPGELVDRQLDQLLAAGARVVVNDVMTVTDRPSRPGETFQVSATLVARCTDDLRARRLVQAIVEFASIRGAHASARHVTSAEQDEELRALGVRLARGPLYGSALTSSAMGALLERSASGTYRALTGAATGRTRSSRAWQELRTVVSSLPVSALACTADGTIVLAEGGLYEHLGINPAALIGTSVTDLAQDRLTDLAPLERALRGEPVTATLQVGEAWVESHMHPVHGPDGEVTGLMTMAIDVTARVQAELAMGASERRFRVIFDQAPVGVALVGPDSRIQQTNNALAAMLGHTPEELAGRELTSLWHPETPPGSDQEYDDLRRSHGPNAYRAERAYRHKDGSPVWTRVTVGALNPATEPGTVIGIVEDLREVKALEVELRHAQKLESIGMLAAGIAHEVNTPTQFVGDNLTFLDDAFATLDGLLRSTERLTRPVDDDAARELETARDAADLDWLREQIPAAVAQSLDGIGRVSTIVAAMRNFGHPDGRDATPIDVNAAIRDTTTVTRNEYKYVADLTLELGDVPTVLGYPSEFNQVILNLVINAAHAIAAVDGRPGLGTIHVRTWSDDATVHVSVSDDGCGMTAQTREHVFDPFFTTKPVGQGTGQGLAIARNVIVDKHGGAIDVQSEPGAGSTFTVHLPLRPPVRVPIS